VSRRGLRTSRTFHFFGGKGGVGKTTCAAAHALAAAAAGRRVLAVSTDPAHSLGDALDLPLGPEPAPVPTRRGSLTAVELAAEPAWERWLAERREGLAALALRGTYLDREDVDRLFGLPMPGIDELVGLLELARLARVTACDEVVVDTAPTAHTLRLLAMPAALERLAELLAAMRRKHQVVAERLVGAVRPDAADALVEQIAAEAALLTDLVRDPARARFHWVLLPEALSVAETRDALAELAAVGVPLAGAVELVVNRLTPPPPEPCRACDPRRVAERQALDELARAFPALPVRLVPAAEREPRGRAALLRLAAALVTEAPSGKKRPGREETGSNSVGAELVSAQDAGTLADEYRGAARLSGAGAETSSAPTQKLLPVVLSEAKDLGGGKEPPAWLDRLAPPGLRLLMFGGKGGVGKTTCAAAAALLLAEQDAGRQVLVMSTDPAHSLADVLLQPLGDDERPVAGAPPNLRARELDAPAIYARWRARLREGLAELLGDGEAGGFDVALDRAVVERLLEVNPPGLDELIAILELAELTAEPPAGGARLVVLDTAPTGHALRLLEMPELALAWDHALLAILLKYRQALGLGDLAAELVELAKRLRRLRELLADPERTRLVAVTRAAELPRRETERLLAALERLGVAAPAVLVNALTRGDCSRCRRAAAAERRRLAALRRGRADIMLAPAAFPPPRGAAALSVWGRSWTKAR
jgi:arsenite-transporting ATPase